MAGAAFDTSKLQFEGPLPSDDTTAAPNPYYARNSKWAKPGPYYTPLDPNGEKSFRQWVTANKVPFDPNETNPDYDMRGYYKALTSGDAGAKTAVDPNDKKLHFPDTYKTPYHETFSRESRYALPSAPGWTKDDKLVDTSGKVIFDDRAPRKPESSAPDFDPSKLQFESSLEEEKPSFLKRAAAAANLVAGAITGTPTFGAEGQDDIAAVGKKVLGGLDRLGESAEAKLESIGKVDVPYGSAGGKELHQNLTAYDAPKAAELALSMGTAPLIGADVAAGGLKGALGLGLGIAGGNEAQKLTQEGLDQIYPSRAFHARLLKWLAANGANYTAMGALMASPHVLSAMRDGAKLHAPDLIPEEPAPEPQTAAEAPEGALPDTKPPEAASEPAAAPLAGLTPKPEQEPELLPRGPTEMGPEPAVEAKGPTAVSPSTGAQPREGTMAAAQAADPEYQAGVDRLRKMFPRAALRLGDKVFVGKPGQIHGEIMMDNPATIVNLAGEKLDSGFVDPEGKFHTNAEASEKADTFADAIKLMPTAEEEARNQPTAPTDQAAVPIPEALQAAHEETVGKLSQELSQYPGGEVQKVPVKDIATDPARFQYKLNTNKEGAGVSLTKAKFNPNLADTALLYHDPEDEKLYVVNGHNRLALAKDSDFPYLESKVIDGGNSYPGAIMHNASVEDARSLGAMQNIAGEKGTAVDAAKFFRDQKATPEDLKTIGIDMGAKMTEDALALQKLDANLFHFVTVGELTPNQGVIIGQELGDSPAAQNAAFKWLKGREAAGKDIPNDVLKEVAADIRDTPEATVDDGQGGLFGEEFMKKSLFEERGTVMAGIKRKIAAERSAFGNAAKNKVRLEGAGNVLTDENAALAEKANTRLQTLAAKKTGPINEALNKAAQELANNPKAKNKIIDAAYEAITKAADETLPPKEEPEEPGLFGKPAKSPAEPGFSLGVSVPGGPQLAKAIEPTLRYAADTFSGNRRTIARAVRGWLFPQMLGPEAARSHQIYVEAAAEKSAMLVPDAVALAPLRAEMEKIPEDQWRRRYEEFYDAYEHGQVPPGLPSKFAPLMGRIQEAYDERWRTTNALRARRGREPMGYLDNYLTHLYADDPAKVRETLARIGNSSGRPLTRGTPFLNERKYLDIGSAMRAGLTPRYKNPIDMILAGLHQFDSYNMAETMFSNMKDAGLLRYFKVGKYEDGWEKIPDSFFKSVQYNPEAGGLVERGDWRAPSDVVKVLTNHLAPNDSIPGKAIRTMVGPGSSVAQFNAFRVGFSTFHFLNENNAAYAQLQGSGVARAVMGMVTGDTSEVRNGMRAFAKGVEPVGSVAKLFNDGDKIMRALIQPGTQGAEYDRAVQAAISGGMRFKPEEMGTLGAMLKKAAMDVRHPLADDLASAKEAPLPVQYLKGALRTPGNLADLSSTALMNYYVPRVKLGAFYKLAAQELDHYVAKTGGNLPWVMQREILQNVAAHVDSVFGQMVQDNLGMSQAMKDTLHFGIAYPGWNIGSVRLALKAGQGAAIGAGRTLGLTQRSLDSQQRLALHFMLGMFTSQGIQNAMLMKLLTGQYPKTLQDLFQPQDGTKDPLGNPGRIAPPSYSRTYISMASHPVSWMQNIQNPVWGILDDMVNNRERFTGKQLVDPQAPLVDQVKQAGEYAVRTLAPFSMSNAQRMGDKATAGEKALGYAGYSPVPAQYLRTAAENYVYKLAGDKAPRVGLNERQYRAKQVEAALEDAGREERPLDPKSLKILNDLSPGLKAKVIKDASNAARLPRIVNMMRRMSLHDVIDTYEIAEKNGDVRNQKYAKAVIEDKNANMDPSRWEAEMDALDPATRERYQNLLSEIIMGKKPGEEPAATEPPA